MPDRSSASKTVAIEALYQQIRDIAGFNEATAAKIRQLLKLDRGTKSLVCKRIHCDNCDKVFMQKKPWGRFCCDTCRKEFHRFGSAYGKLRAQLLKVIEESTGKIVGEVVREEVAARTREIRSGLDSLRGDGIRVDRTLLALKRDLETGLRTILSSQRKEPEAPTDATGSISQG